MGPGWSLACGSRRGQRKAAMKAVQEDEQEISLSLSPEQQPPRELFPLNTNTPISSITTTCTSTVSDSTSTTTKKKSTKPPNSRVLMEVDMLKNMMERHMFCPSCSSAVVISFPTVCIASGCRIQCSNELCNFVKVEKPVTANFPLPAGHGSALIERSTDYAANILYVLGFISCGDGGKEAERILGLLGLSNATTMEKRSFGLIENRISQPIQSLTDEILLENLHIAVERHYNGRKHNDRLLYDMWKEQLLPANLEKELLPRHLYPELTNSADMGWQKRSSGNSYSSASGHALLVDSLTRKPIAAIVKSKICNICGTHERGDYRKQNNAGE